MFFYPRLIPPEKQYFIVLHKTAHNNQECKSTSTHTLNCFRFTELGLVEQVKSIPHFHFLEFIKNSFHDEFSVKFYSKGVEVSF